MKLIRLFTQRPHAQNILINLFGNYISFFFAAFYIVFLVRVFEPEPFGVLSILLIISYVLANILNFGMPASIYAHVPELLSSREKTFDFIKTNFLLLSVLSGSVLIALFFVIEPLDRMFIKIDAPRNYYALAFIGTQLFIWQNYIRDILNAAGKFLHINIAVNISNVIKMIILVYLTLTHQLTIVNTLVTLQIIGPLVVFLVVLFERRWIVTSFMNSKTQLSNIKFGYTAMYFFAMQMFNIASRADIFFISFYLTTAEVGYYSLSQRIVLAIVTSVDSITQVLSPQFSQAKSQNDVYKLLKHSFVFMLLPAIIFLGVILTPSQIYSFVFTHSYDPAILATRALSFAYILYPFLAASVLFFLYTVKKPHHVLIVNLILFGSILFSGSTIVPKIGLYGPAVAYMIGFLLISVYIFTQFKKEMTLLKKQEKNAT